MMKHGEKLNYGFCGNVNLTCHQIRQIHESDEKDFFSQAENVICEIEHQMTKLPYVDIHMKIQEIKDYSQHNPNRPVQKSKIKLAQDITYIHELLMAHRQDWESDCK